MSEDLEIRRRHTTGHIMSAAVGMIYPEVKRGVGPWTDTGVYQDFDFGEQKVSENDFKAIEKKMRWIVNKDFKVESKVLSEKEARAIFEHDEYKQELIDDILERGEALSFYDFVDDSGKVCYHDLCAGPHLDSTGQVGVFKLMKIAGSYWRGDADKPMLTRIYAVAFADKDGLEEYETFLREAEARDHRKLGSELGLFCFSEKVGAGLPMFTPKGTFIRDKVGGILRDLKEKYGYQTVWIPHITKKELYETSGHWDKFKDDLFHVKGKGETAFVMKPMNCPHHTQIYASGMKSYRDLPVRYAETTTCYRDEQPGELLGLSRVRSITQDDTHIFCRIDQIKDEAHNVIRIIEEFYRKLGMYGEDNFWVSLSVRDPQTPEKYLGDPKNWDKAEEFLDEVATKEGFQYKRVEGEAAFYGPKLDFQFKDAIGREWQLATLQVDFVQPENFKLEYIDEKGDKVRPVMIHIAIAGSLERFMSVLIEHFAGAFPAWLAPVQAHILPISDNHVSYAAGLLENITASGGRAQLIDPSDSLGKRVRNAQTQKIPFAVIVGDEETKSNLLTVRKYGEEKDEKVAREDFLGWLAG